jgi:hypothetical protein
MAEFDTLRPAETEIKTNPRDDGANLDGLGTVAAAAAANDGGDHHHHEFMK